MAGHVERAVAQGLKQEERPFLGGLHCMRRCRHVPISDGRHIDVLQVDARKLSEVQPQQFNAITALSKPVEVGLADLGVARARRTTDNLNGLLAR
jgi:hypothetical protein